MTDQPIAPPPDELLRALTPVPEAETILAEVRTDASLSFDPAAAPAYLTIANARFGALVAWRVDLSWNQAQEVQLWLTGAPSGGIAGTREEALTDFFETLETGAPPASFIDYVGTYLATGLSHASYTLLLGMREPIPRDDYQAAFLKALNDLKATAGAAGWYAELVQFLKLMLAQPSSREDFLSLASNIGDLAQKGPSGQPLYPLIQLLIT